jgi:hypothetical protein
MSSNNMDGLKAYTATEALVEGRRVKYTSGSGTAVEYADAGEDYVGITMSTVAITEPVTVWQKNKIGTVRIEAAGAITVGATLYGANDGKVSATPSGEPQFIAENAASATAAFVECVPFGSQAANAFASIDDVNGNESIIITATASAVNEFTATNAATGDEVRLSATGDDANVGLEIMPKGTGVVSLLDGNGNEVLLGGTTASAVNEVTITNAATGNGPTISATGETNVDLNLQPKGTGVIQLLDGNGNEVLLGGTTAAAVNEVTITNASTGNGPTISATGETNVDLNLAAKGTGTTAIPNDFSFTGHKNGQIKHFNAFQFPVPATEIVPSADGAAAAAGLSGAVCYLPLTGLVAGEELVSFDVLGYITSGGNAVTVDAALYSVLNDGTNAAITGGGITQVSKTGAYTMEETATLSSPEVITNLKQYYILITITTGAGATANVTGIEMTMNSK